jgi:hypothetical protein
LKNSSGFTIEYRYVTHSEVVAESQKTRYVAGGGVSDLNIVGVGVSVPLLPWPFFSALFLVCPLGNALLPGAAITLNINQVFHQGSTCGIRIQWHVIHGAGRLQRQTLC